MLLRHNIKKFRLGKKLSLRALSEKSGISKTTISEMENGIVTNPTLDTMEKLSEALDVSFDCLTGEALFTIIENRLEKLGITLPELSKRADVSLDFLNNLERLDPDEGDYNNMNQIAKVLNLRPGILHAALARQEPPVYDSPIIGHSPEEDFTVIDDEAPTESSYTLSTHKLDSYYDDLSDDEQVAVRAFIETYRQIKRTNLKE